MIASDGKRRMTDCLPQKEMLALLEVISGRNVRTLTMTADVKRAQVAEARYAMALLCNRRALLAMT